MTHDLLWNLVPTKQEINSRKGDSIPSLETYLEKFLRNQHSAFRIVYEKGKTRLLEDYVNLFQADLETIYSTEIGDFCQRLEATIRPLEQIAGNQGFDTEWQLN